MNDNNTQSATNHEINHSNSINNKKATKKIVGIIIGLALVVAVVLVCIFVFGGSKIKNMEDLRQAIVDRKALNCSATTDSGQSVTIQGNKGFEKLKMINGENASNKVYFLILKDDGIYYWDDSGSTAFKMAYSDSMVNELVDDATAVDDTEEDGGGYELKCESAGKADFSVPAGVDFTDLSNVSQ